MKKFDLGITTEEGEKKSPLRTPKRAGPTTPSALDQLKKKTGMDKSPTNKSPMNKSPLNKSPLNKIGKFRDRLNATSPLSQIKMDQDQQSASGSKFDFTETGINNRR